MSQSQADRIRHCLDGLNQIDRYTVLMFFADDLSCSEIGLVLDISPLRVRQTLNRFRERAAAEMVDPSLELSVDGQVTGWLASATSAYV
jgi:DNA-directed RNA polymerase specialized sigma24 family protein